MPKLILFAPCQRILEDTTDHTITLFGLIETLAFAILPEQVLAPDEAAPFDWSVVSTWRISEEDRGRPFQIRLCRVFPDGEESTGNVATTVGGEETAHLRIIFRIQSIQIGRPGLQYLRLYIRESGEEEREWELAGEYPFLLQHLVQEPAPQRTE